MSGKRQATSDLNHDNWDQDEEPEERGTFRTANESELKNRIIKKATRRRVVGCSIAGEDAADGGDVAAKKSAFSGFAGFGKPAAAATSAASPFSFLSKIPSVAANTTSAAAGTTPTFSFGAAVATSSTANTTATVSFGGAATVSSSTAASSTKPTFSFGGASTVKSTTIATSPARNVNNNNAKTDEKSITYYAKLKGLNQAVSDWIKTHVDKNPICLLTPIFKDYEKYLSEIDKEESSKPSNDNVNNKIEPAASTSNAATNTTNSAAANSTFGNFKFSAASSSTAAPVSNINASPTKFNFGSANTSSTTGSIFGAKPAPATETTPKTNGFSFGAAAAATKSSNSSEASSSTAKPAFSFGSAAATSSDEQKPFSFTPGAAAFSFGNIKPPAASSSAPAADNDGEDEEPPKVEFKQVVEDDAVYSKKCKVFVKKDGNFADRGVGTLYLKPVKDTDKTQLLVRADTNLGNILVNIILNESIPSQRMGKNNVMMVCLPTPNEQKPTSILLRVKTGEEADELLATIEKYIKK